MHTIQNRSSIFFIIAIAVSVITPARANDPVEITGDVLAYALPLAAAGLTACLKDWTGTVQLGESGVLSEAVTLGLKYTVREPRPNGKDNYSFPSQHTSVSCASAEFAWKRYGWKYGAPMYLLAAFVGYSRIESKNHYFHDVIAGAAIGIASSFIFAKPYHGMRVSATVSAERFTLKCTGNL
jgi:membrane-associated phospholipid phosphatase